MAEDNRFRVLLVEDDAIQVNIIRKVLETASKTPVRVEVVGNLETALLVLRDKDNQIDSILLDLNLPDSTGLETVIKVQEMASDIPVVVMTGDDDEKIALEALRRGAQDYLVKGEMQEKMLLRALRYAVERKNVESTLKYTKDRLEQSNRELKNAQLQLIQAAKLEIVGRLAAGVAHEVKNPLSMITMGIDYLNIAIKEKNERTLFMLKSMSEAVRRADLVLREMLDFSSPQKLSLKPENLAEVINRSLILVKHELDKNQINVRLELDEKLVSVMIDRKQMEQVLINLYTNAIRAMEQKGELVIRTFIEELKGFSEGVGYRKDDVLTPGDRVAVVEIDDSGPGIPETLLTRVFDPFFTTNRDKGGTGLGLSVVKTMIQMHRGLMTLKNRPEGGARATIKLKLDEK